jgi:hypothetical protein
VGSRAKGATGGAASKMSKAKKALSKPSIASSRPTVVSSKHFAVEPQELATASPGLPSSPLPPPPSKKRAAAARRVVDSQDAPSAKAVGARKKVAVEEVEEIEDLSPPRRSPRKHEGTRAAGDAGESMAGVEEVGEPSPSRVNVRLPLAPSRPHKGKAGTTSSSPAAAKAADASKAKKNAGSASGFMAKNGDSSSSSKPWTRLNSEGDVADVMPADEDTDLEPPRGPATASKTAPKAKASSAKPFARPKTKITDVEEDDEPPRGPILNADSAGATVIFSKPSTRAKGKAVNDDVIVSKLSLPESSSRMSSPKPSPRVMSEVAISKSGALSPEPTAPQRPATPANGMVIGTALVVPVAPRKPDPPRQLVAAQRPQADTKSAMKQRTRRKAEVEEAKVLNEIGTRASPKFPMVTAAGGDGQVEARLARPTRASAVAASKKIAKYARAGATASSPLSAQLPSALETEAASSSGIAGGTRSLSMPHDARSSGREHTTKGSRAAQDKTKKRKRDDNAGSSPPLVDLAPAHKRPRTVPQSPTPRSATRTHKLPALRGPAHAARAKRGGSSSPTRAPPSIEINHVGHNMVSASNLKSGGTLFDELFDSTALSPTVPGPKEKKSVVAGLRAKGEGKGKGKSKSGDVSPPTAMGQVQRSTDVSVAAHAMAQNLDTRQQPPTRTQATPLREPSPDTSEIVANDVLPLEPVHRVLSPPPVPLPPLWASDSNAAAAKVRFRGLIA